MTAGNPDPIICAILRREPCPWDAGWGPEAISRFIRAARHHGVLPLLDAEFRTRSDLAAWPREILLACLKATLVQTTWEPAHRAEITRVIDALAAGGVLPLVLKGSALACTLYADPSLRPRSDTDLLVPPGRRAQADRILAGLGYAMAPGVAGDFISYQALWSRTDASGVIHRVDLHWRINNSQVLARVFGYEELAARSEPLPCLGPSARALGPVDALLLACVHLAGHAAETFRDDGVVRSADDRLIWLYDIHLLAGRMSEAQFEAFAELAAARRTRAICLDALRRSHECFGTAIPPRLREALSRAGAPEPSARLLSAGAGRRMVDDFLAIEAWSDRIRWLGELAFPSAGYMRWKYPDAERTWLPVLYLRRAFSAVGRLGFPGRRGI